MCNEYELTNPVLQMGTGKDDIYGPCPQCNNPMSVGDQEAAGICTTCYFDLHNYEKKEEED